MDSTETFFAPAQRATVKGLLNDVELVGSQARGCPFLDVSPALMLILNSQRQIVYVNESVLAFLNPRGGVADVIGKRPGEAFNCENCDSAPNGCGTGERCRTCGAVISIMECLEHNRKSISECHLTRQGGFGIESLDLRVSSTPLLLEGERYVVFNAVDISDETRRNYLEGVFIHEVRNSAGNVLTLSGMVADEFSSSEVGQMLLQASKHLMDEIDGHRMLIEAETGRLKPVVVGFSPVQLLQRIAAESLKTSYGEGKAAEVLNPSDDVMVNGDSAVLTRILSNLLKNALEATKPGQKVKLSCLMVGGGRIAFSVWNDCAMNQTIQSNIFHRAFSTKGGARGIGAYMARLLTERYLGGKISFTSSPEAGTTFVVEIPLEAKNIEG